MLEDATFRARHAQQRCDEANRSIAKQVREFDAQYTYSGFAGFTVGRLIEETKLHVDLAFQDRFGNPIVVPDAAKYTSVLEQIEAKQLSTAEADECKARLRTHVTRPIFRFGDAELPEVIVDVNAFIKTDLLRDTAAQLETTDEAVGVLEARIASMQSDWENARCEERFAEADQFEDEQIRAYRELFALRVKRLALVGSADSGGGSEGLCDQLEKIMDVRRVDALRAEKDQLKHAVITDLKTLDSDRVQRHQHHQAATSAYEAAAKRSVERIERNAYQQQRVWDDVVAGLARISELSSDADQMVKDHLQLTQTEQKRRKEYDEYKQCLAQHREYVTELHENTLVGLGFLARVEDFLADARKTVAERNIEDRLRALATCERAKLDDLYGAMSSRVVRRLHATNVRASNVERLAREAHFQVQQAVATDDAERASHVSRRDQLQRKLAELSREHSESEAMFDHDQQSYFAVCGSGGSDEDDQNPGYRAALLRKQLREDYAAALETLLEGQAALSSNLHKDVEVRSRAVHDARKQREERGAAKRDAAQLPV